jgi:hypothetical protein
MNIMLGLQIIHFQKLICQKCYGAVIHPTISYELSALTFAAVFISLAVIVGALLLWQLIKWLYGLVCHLSILSEPRLFFFCIYE